MAASNTDSPQRGRAAIIIFVVAMVAAIAILAAFVVLRGDEATADPGRSEAETFLQAWSAGDAARMGTVAVPAGAPIADDLRAATGALVTRSGSYRLVGLSELTGEKNRRTATFDVARALCRVGPWKYQSSFPLTKTETGWRVEWGPTVIHPDLTAGARFDRARVWAPRAQILDAAGQPLSASMVNIGIKPSGVTDKPRVIKTLADALQIDEPTVTAAMTPKPGADPTAIVVVKTIPRTVFEPLQKTLGDVPGIFFTRVGGDTGASVPEALQAYVIGKTGVATAEQAAALGAPYLAGDLIGISGLEGANQKTLAGTPTIEVRLVNPDGAVKKVVQTVPGAAPVPLRTTIDRNLQVAAENVLRTKGAPAALVAVDRNGGIKAMASFAPSANFNRAVAYYPPGSTMKIVAAEALVSNGLTPASTLSCPPTITAAGTTIRNSEGGSSPPLPFTDAFAMSCNTAFVGAMQNIPAATMVDIAGRNGFEVAYDIGIATESKDKKGGRFPNDGEGAVRTVNAIGQGKVEATPLHMASVASAALTGQWKSPSFLAERPTTLPTVPALDPTVPPALAAFMRAVVAQPNGTGNKANAPGKVVSGKTGTAEYGPKNPPETHAWFVGHNGDLSVAVVVEGGGYGGDVAAPLVGQFFALVP